MAPKVGEIVVLEGRSWRITEVLARLTPYHKRNQDTTVEGYTLSLVKVEEAEEKNLSEKG